MLFLRLLFGGLLLAAIVCFGMSLLTRDLKWRQRGITVLKWTVVAALVSGFLLWLPTAVRG